MNDTTDPNHQDMYKLNVISLPKVLTQMLHILKTVLGAAVLTATFLWTFGTPWQAEDTTLLDIPSSSERIGGRQGAGGRNASARIPEMDVVSMTPFSEMLSAIGTSRAVNSITIISEVSGLVVEADMGARRWVEEGDVILRLSDTVEQIEVTTSRAQLAAARQSLDRYLSLSQSNTGAVAQSTVQEAEVAVALADAAVERAEYALDQRTIRAPISGQLSLTNIRPGDRLQPATEIVTIDDTESILVSFVLPERAVEMLEIGKKIRATTPALAGRGFTATITAFDSRVDENTRTIAVEAEIENLEGRLWPGMSFAVELERQSMPLPQIPASALSWARDGARIWVVRDGVAASVPVLVRMRQGDTVWVEGEIDVEDHIVVDGAARLHDGMQLETRSQPDTAESEQGNLVDEQARARERQGSEEEQG